MSSPGAKFCKAVCVVLLGALPVFAGDLKVKQMVTTVNENYPEPRSSQFEETIYVQGSRERMEYRVPETPDGHQPHTAEIYDCRTLNVYQIDFNSDQYAEVKARPFLSKEQMHKFLQEQEAWSKKRYAMQTTDTGEKRTLFGLVARHFVTSIRSITPADRSEATIDGWYAALPEPGCAPEYMRQGEAIEARLDFLARGGSNNVYTGFVPPGLAVAETVITRSRFELKGRQVEIVTVVEKKLTELSQESLDPALFSVPAGFEKVDRLPANRNLSRPTLKQRNSD